MGIAELILALFSDYTLQNVALGAAILGVVSGTLGSFAVLRKQSLLGDAMSHAALPGVVLVFILTGLKTPLALLLGAFASAWLGALLMMLVTRRTRTKEDSGLGIVLAVFFGLGLALLSWVQRNMDASQSGLDKYLFGSAAAIIREDVVVMGVVGGIAVLLVALFWKEFKLLTFDPDFASTLGFPVYILHGLLMTLIVVGVVVGLQMVGVVLMAAMIVAPASAARQWTDRLGVMIFLSGLFGGIAGVSGALVSASARGLSTGPVIVLVVSAIVFFSLLFAPNRGLIWDWVRRRRNNKRLSNTRVLEALYLMAQRHDDVYYPHSARSLQAALPGYNVSNTLTALASAGLVTQADHQAWSLTEPGVKQVEDLLTTTQGQNGASLAHHDDQPAEVSA